MNTAPRHNLTQTTRTVTIRGYIVWDPAVSRRIWEACRQQAAAHNRAVSELLERPETPLRKSTRNGITGLQGLWTAWRQKEPALGTILQAVWRPGVSLAKSRVDAWEKTNEEQAEALLTDTPETDKPAPRTKSRPGRRRLRAKTLYRSRKRSDRRRQNRLVLHEGVRALDTRTIRVPGVGDVRLREPIRKDFQVRSATLIDRTPHETGRNATPEERSWKIHLTTRVARPLRPLPEMVASAGIDHGVVHAETVAYSNGESEHVHYETPEPTRSRRYDRLQQRKDGCRRRRRPSRRRRALQRQQNRMRARALRRRAHQRREWANRIAQQNDLVGIELLQNANMRGSARGTSEQPGRNVAAKSGLNRRLSESAPGYQTTELVAACVRHGTRYRLVPAGGTSITCARCGHRNRKNRESQAGFRCQQCQHQANADVNAADVVRLLAEALTRVGVSRSWAVEQTARSAEAARRKAGKAREASAAPRSTEARNASADAGEVPAEGCSTKAAKSTATQVMRQRRRNLRFS